MFISDTHLGTKGASADKLLDFLNNLTCKKLVLVGDIIDGWALSRKVYWPATHQAVVQRIINMAQKGTEVVYIPGNHDEPLKHYDSLVMGNIRVEMNHRHTLQDGRVLLCVHGDDFDIVTRHHRWVAVLGDIAYESLLKLNRVLNKARARFGMGYWSLSSYVKHKVKSVVSFIGDYQENVVREAIHQDVDGVLCGHIHHPEIEFYDSPIPGKSFVYINTGDWVETCSYVVEHHDGRIELHAPGASVVSVEPRPGEFALA